MTHTEVPAPIERRGIGSALVRAALEDARARQLRVVPLCSFVGWYIEQHQEYGELVARQASTGR
jgi:predicted GNAT family acetyltransferase